MAAPRVFVSVRPSSTTVALYSPSMAKEPSAEVPLRLYVTSRCSVGVAMAVT